MTAPASTPATVLGPDTHIKGEMSFSGDAQLLGTFEGRITSKAKVFIGEGATCRATLEAQFVAIDGLVEGDVLAHERVDLSATAVVKGDLIAHSLVVSEGASFCGHCKVGHDAAIEASKAAERRNMMAAGLSGMPGSPAIEPKPVRPLTRQGEVSVKTDRIARAAAALESDPEWQQLASA